MSLTNPVVTGPIELTSVVINRKMAIAVARLRASASPCAIVYCAPRYE